MTLAGRRQILAVHTRDVPLAPDLDLDAIAAATPGMVGADLAKIVNEAALLAARGEHVSASAANFADALEKIVLGTARGIRLSREERERTAYHEAGHALLGMFTPGADPAARPIAAASRLCPCPPGSTGLPGPGRDPDREPRRWPHDNGRLAVAPWWSTTYTISRRPSRSSRPSSPPAALAGRAG
jgi:SpoVK/Ycf46/Vps4 family AAA+-type ATPase